MHRIDTPDVSVDKFGTGKDGYKDGTPAGSSSTSLDADMFDAFQEEIVKVVEDNGEVLLKTDLTQLASAIAFKSSMGALHNWTLRTSTGSDTAAVASHDIDDPGFGSEVVMMGADTNGQRSTDQGETWASVTGQSQDTRRIAYGNSQYIAVGSGSVNIQSSPTGVTWTSEDTGTGDGRDVVFDATIGSGLWCVAGFDGASSWLVTSPDGLAWTERTAAGTQEFFGVASNGTVFVAVGDAGTIETSTDGTTWTARTAAGSYTDIFRDVIWTGSTFVAIGDATGSDTEVQLSVDGITWTQSNIVGGGDGRSIWDIGGLIVLQASKTHLNHGRCSGTWQTLPRRGSPTSSTLIIIAMAYVGGRAVAGTGAANTLFTSNVLPLVAS